MGDKSHHKTFAGGRGSPTILISEEARGLSSRNDCNPKSLDPGVCVCVSCSPSRLSHPERSSLRPHTSNRGAVLWGSRRATRTYEGSLGHTHLENTAPHPPSSAPPRYTMALYKAQSELQRYPQSILRASSDPFPRQ